MVGKILKAQSILSRQCPLQKLLDILTEFLVDRIRLADLLQKLIFVGVLPREGPMQEHIKNHAQAPDISFLVEHKIPSALWTLVGVEPDIPSAFLAVLADFPGVTESAYFDDLILNKKAGGL